MPACDSRHYAPAGGQLRRAPDDAQPALHAAILSYASQPLVLRKVHDCFWRTSSGDAIFDASVSRGAIYLVRDPRDVSVSWAHHRGATLDRIIEKMADPAVVIAGDPGRLWTQLPQPLGTWSGHISSWLDGAHMPTLVLRYEDLLADPHGCLAVAARHLGIATDVHMIERAVETTRFDVLRAQEEAWGFRERRPGSTAPFFRRGVAGDWRNWLSAAQEASLVYGHRAAMARFGYL